MHRRGLWRVVGFGALVAAAYVLWRVAATPRDIGDDAPPPEPAPRAWVEPVGRVCPVTHPVKAKLASGIYHEPGGASYGRTAPDRCYRDGGAARADDLRPAKR